MASARSPIFALACAIPMVVAWGSAARADIDPLSGIDFVRIGSPGNAPWPGNGTLGDTAIGRGSVGYEYSIGRLEVTTAQWVEFMNAAFDRPAGDAIPHVNVPSLWLAASTVPQNGGQRWTVPTGRELFPVGGVSWRTCAIYCNWLSNRKSLARSAFLNGAYDVSTFGSLAGGFTDQVTRNASAQYWIPSWDEHLKAAHFDPDRNGPGQAGWWLTNNTLGRAATAGPPPTGEANYGTSPTTFLLALGSYPNVHSAYGLLDLAGETAEWTEYVFRSGGQNQERGIEGSWWGSDTNAVIGDTIYTRGLSGVPGYAGYEVGLRLASSVPAPGSALLLAGVFAGLGRRTRRKRPCARGDLYSSPV